MRFIFLCLLSILSSCSMIPFLAEEAVEFEEKAIQDEIKTHERKEILTKNQNLCKTALHAKWYWEETDECDCESKPEKIKEFEDYYWYHFGDVINKVDLSLRLRKQKWPWGFGYDEFDDWYV